LSLSLALSRWRLAAPLRHDCGTCRERADEYKNRNVMDTHVRENIISPCC
jgi:hypothetical protein